MEFSKYNEMKKTAIGLIQKAKSTNPELGDYLERHFVMDDKSRTFMYTGANTVLEELMKSEVI
jgi:hypothetical protein